MIGAGDRVTVEGEEGIWEVDMAGNDSPMVRIIQNRNAATWKMIDRAKLTLVPTEPSSNGDLPGLFPARGILD